MMYKKLAFTFTFIIVTCFIAIKLVPNTNTHNDNIKVLKQCNPTLKKNSASIEPVLLTQSKTTSSFNPIEHSKFKVLVEELIKKPAGTASIKALEKAVEQWAEHNPMAAISYILSRTAHLNLLDTVMDVAGNKQDDNVLIWLANNQNNMEQSYLAKIYFKAYTKVSATDALIALELNFNTDLKNLILPSIIDEWASTNADAVFTWLDSQQNNALTDQLRNRATIHFIEQSPWDATNIIKALPKGEDKNKLLTMLVSKLSSIDIYDAIDWANMLPQDEKLLAISVVMKSWITQNTSEAPLDYFITQQQLQLNLSILKTVIPLIAQNDLDSLINQQSEFLNVNQNIVVKSIATELLKNDDFYEYDVWYESLPKGTQRGIASAMLVEANLNTNPSLAFQYAQNVINPTQREKYLMDVAKSWGRENLAQAQLAIQSCDVLTDEQKNNILKIL